MTHPSVFISYSHDSPEHADRVLALANRLRRDGIDCVLDQYETSPPEGWPRWMDRCIRDADFVLVVCTETYYRRVMGDEEPGAGRGVRWEGGLIYQDIYDAYAENTRFIPVLFEAAWVDYIPRPLKGATYHHLHTEQGYEALLRHLTGQPGVVKPPLGELPSLPPRERKTDFLPGVAGFDLPLDDIPPITPLPPGSRMPLSPNPLFVGRQEDLMTLAKALKGGDTAATRAVRQDGIGQIAAATGMGGIGKTQLAAEFVHRYGQFFAGGVFWLSFANPEAIPAEVAACGERGGLDLPPGFSQLPFALYATFSRSLVGRNPLD